MGTDTAIEWAHHTFNAWRGCEKVSAGCRGCYAEAISTRFPAVLGQWGPNGTRAEASEAYWETARRWDRAARRDQVRRRVFCLSMGDVFEDRPELKPLRLRLLTLIMETPSLDWLLLTKRPENIFGALADAFEAAPHGHAVGPWLYNWLQGEPPHNVWLGTSVENQAAANTRLQWLLMVPAVRHFVSYEPALGPVDFTQITVTDAVFGFQHPQTGEPLAPLSIGVQSAFDHPENVLPYCLDWVICGGESGPAARPLHPNWVRNVQQQCQQAGVSFMLKQWGEWVPQGQLSGGDYGTNGRQPWLPADATHVWRVGKKTGGRTLDGRIYDEVPQPEPLASLHFENN